MKKFIAAAAISALTLSAIPAATAAPVFGSSGSSLLGSSAPDTPEQQIRNAIEDYLVHQGYTIDRDLTSAAQQYVTANYGPDRDAAYEALFDAGMASGSGGIFASNPELIIQQFATHGEPQPDNGQIAAVGIDYGIVTTEIMVYYGN